MNLEALREGKVFVINKPLGWTSFDVVKKIRYNIKQAYGLKKFKVGHAGTLDPKATGILIICVGKFTKRISEFQNQPKTYLAEIKLGATTESYDTEQPENQTFPIDHITEQMILSTLQMFEGEIEQYPPAHSAVRLKGKRLYEMARAGEEIELPVRKVKINKIKLINIDLPLIKIEVECEKGTYIRSLAHDVGQALNSGAYLTNLCRTKSGSFSLEDANNAPLEENYFKA